MRARVLKKLLRQVLSGQVEVLTVPRGAALAVRYPASWPQATVTEALGHIRDIAGLPVIGLPDDPRGPSITVVKKEPS